MTSSSSSQPATISSAAALAVSSVSATASPFKSPKWTLSRNRWTSASRRREGERPHEPPRCAPRRHRNPLDDLPSRHPLDAPAPCRPQIAPDPRDLSEKDRNVFKLAPRV